jgi:hypothetical protein
MAKTKNTVQQAQRLGLFGSSGCGKTTKARELTKNLNRVIFIDPLCEWVKEKDIKPVYTLDGIKKALKKQYNTGFRFAFIPEFGKEVQQVDELCYFLAGIQSGYISGSHAAQLTLVVDELDISFPSGICQKNPKNGFAYLCRRGRHYGINLVGISQRTAQVDVCFRANCSGTYLFRHSDPIDTEKAIKILGVEWKEKFLNLSNYEYIFKSGYSTFLHTYRKTAEK